MLDGSMRDGADGTDMHATPSLDLATAPPAGRTRVVFAGDWHGNTGWALEALRRTHRAGIDTVIHVGDFGLWPGSVGSAYLSRVLRAADELGITLRVVPGNHEDWARLGTLHPDESGWLQLNSRTPVDRFAFAPRAHTWEHHGVRLAALPGAGSIDRLLRTEGRDWWPQEEILDEHVDALITLAAGQSVDVFVSHEAPAGLHRAGMPRQSFMTEDVLHSCYQQRVRLARAVHALAPRSLVHGHWHFWYHDDLELDLGGRCEVFGLDMDGTVGNLLVAELEPGAGIAAWTRLYA